MRKTINELLKEVKYPTEDQVKKVVHAALREDLESKNIAFDGFYEKILKTVC